MSWTVYILECGDGTLYTGITNRLQERIEAHGAGLGAKYTRGRGASRVVYTEPAADRAAASRRETAIKKLTRQAKLKLLAIEESYNRKDAKNAQMMERKDRGKA